VLPATLHSSACAVVARQQREARNATHGEDNEEVLLGRCPEFVAKDVCFTLWLGHVSFWHWLELRMVWASPSTALRTPCFFLASSAFLLIPVSFFSGFQQYCSITFTTHLTYCGNLVDILASRKTAPCRVCLSFYRFLHRFPAFHFVRFPTSHSFSHRHLVVLRLCSACSHSSSAPLPVVGSITAWCFNAAGFCHRKLANTHLPDTVFSPAP
jgi:hypothetical protein